MNFVAKISLCIAAASNFVDEITRRKKNRTEIQKESQYDTRQLYRIKKISSGKRLWQAVRDREWG